MEYQKPHTPSHDIPQSHIPKDTSQNIPEEYRGDIHYLTNFFSDLYLPKESNRFEFQEFLKNALSQRGKTIDDISAFKRAWGIATLYDSDGNRVWKFHEKEYENFLLSNRFWSEKIEDIEKRVHDLQDAIASVYDDNDGYIFDREIDEDDTVSSWPYKGKKLLELQSLLAPEITKIKSIYTITGESTKKTAFLRKHIELLAGVWDIYEWWAKLFSLSEEDLQRKVLLLTEDMSVEEMFQEIIYFNEKIDSNWKKSEMVRQVNAKLMASFYMQTYEKLKEEKRPNADFITFANIITGREKIKKERKVKWQTLTHVETISFDNSMASYDIASKALLHIMYRPDGVFDTIRKEKQELIPWDPELEDKNPRDIVEASIQKISAINEKDEDFWKEVLIQAWMWGLLLSQETNYAKLSFEEKISLWALYRINPIIDTMKGGNFDENVIKNNILQTSQDAFKALENDINDMFDGKSLNLWIAHPNFFWYDADDLWLTWEMWEIFDLYQDIHGNSWFFDLHDENEDWFQEPSNIATLGVWIIAWCILLPLAPATIGGLALAWAGMGFATALTNIVTTKQWHDTYDEAIVDTFYQFFYEVASSAAFMWVFWGFLKKIWAVDAVTGKLKYDVALFFAGDAYSLKGLGDKLLIISEVVAGMFANQEIIKYVREKFQENHFDTDVTTFEEVKSKKTSSAI